MTLPTVEEMKEQKTIKMTLECTMNDLANFTPFWKVVECPVDI